MPRLSRLVLFALLVASLGSHASSQTCTLGPRGSVIFDGVNDFLRIPNNPALDGMTDFTFEAWFRCNPPGGSVFKALFDKGGGDPYLFGVFTQCAAFVENNAVIGGPFVLDNFWHHYAVTASGPTITLFVDGNGIATGTYPNPMNTSAMDLYIGASSGGGPFFDHWAGAIDEIRIWNVARTAQQIEDNRLYTLNGSEAGLIAYYRFDTNNGQVVTNSATATGAALNGFFGPDATVTSEDPLFSVVDFPPMWYCANGVGQANSVAARLEVNGFGAGTGPGPFQASINVGQTVTFSWTGPPNMPFGLITGPLNAANSNFGCVGKFDVGTPPFFHDIQAVFDGLNYPGTLFYVLSPAGTSQQTFTIPAAAFGLTAVVQGVILQPGGAGCPIVLTATFRVSAI